MKFTLLLPFLFVAFLGFSQQNQVNTINEDDCAKYKSLYYEYLKQGLYSDSRSFWLKAAETCGGLEHQNKGFYKNGVAIYKGLRKGISPKDTLTYSAVNDSLSMIYKAGWTKHNEAVWGLEYAFHLYYYASTDPQMDELFENVHLLKEKSPAKYIEAYFKHQIRNKYNKGGVDEREKLKTSILEDYFLLREYCRLGIVNGDMVTDVKKRDAVIQSYEKAYDLLDKYLVKVPLLDEDINELFLHFYESTELDSVQKVNQIDHDLVLLESLKATDLLIYKELVYESLKMRPSGKGFLLVGNMELEQVNNKGAIEAYQKGLDLKPSIELTYELKYKMTIALYQERKYKKAFTLAKEVKGELEGKALKMSGDCIVALANVCGDSTFERKANYWLANDYYNEAIKKGEKLNKNSYSKLWPTNGACFEENIALGSSYKLVCWGEYTVVR